MKSNTKISNAVIKRLPRYRRYLKELQRKGVDKISSRELSDLIGYTASQIRQDLNNFGGFGQQGYGYNVDALYNEISIILGLDREYKMIVVGAGNMGQAIANHTYYYKAGFIVCALFEVNPKLIGLKINDISVLDYENIVEYIEENAIDIGIICTTKDSAQEIADKMAFAGVKGIWNFAPVDLEVPDHIAVENVHLSDGLHSLAYHINRNQNK
ncbi:redox-sensing transcriptional repressor Rex [Clostridium aminobutyricum]|uniref:Redox-sensing transcriptional repressor Rex n=1 Tax=Clostridium aminobutyricum TaxID=33953 RepID=A0A939DBN6_CLOAM|nr:redox-sensing transcriptional repressor Rex [Clostridium aminobutyricum]MBN7774303.1 redox-sensing transcriptional repressor Rex [Clostridium aminobutyricum]